MTVIIRSALVSDALDALGYRHQCLPGDIMPLQFADRVVGRAFTVTAEKIDYVPEIPYRGLLKALDQIDVGEVFVLGTGRTDASAGWGELLTTACQARGAVGAVVDSPVRDTGRLSRLGFPVFGRGRHPSDCNGRLEVTGMGSPIEIGGVTIRTGDIIVGDCDGVVVIPQAISELVIANAVEKGAQEDLFREAVLGGMAPSDAYQKFRVL
jgi:4-hydroxy-4-methyl-2-oxoglutarate aldolase